MEDGFFFFFCMSGPLCSSIVAKFAIPGPKYRGSASLIQPHVISNDATSVLNSLFNFHPTCIRKIIWPLHLNSTQSEADIWCIMYMLGVGLMIRVVGLRSEDPEFKSPSAVELIPGGVDSACNPSEVGKMSASLLVSCVGVVTCPGLCPLAKETAEAAPMLCTQSMVPMDGWMETPFIPPSS